MIRVIFYYCLYIFSGAILATEKTTGDDALSEGRKIYNYRCYYCHGYSGNANTLAARFLEPKPRDFVNSSLENLTREQMISVVTHGKKNTAMTGFTKFLSDNEIALVVDFVRQEFMTNKRENTRYHTAENGWKNHNKYQIAFPFATGEIALDVKQESLTEQQKLGLQLYLTSCITCHDNSRVEEAGDIWQTQSISYPRNNYSFTNFDGMTGASTYQKHDTFPLLKTESAQVKQGEKLYRDNCAFCHAMDGSGQNWIGSFLDNKPQNLGDATFMSNINKEVLKTMIKKGKTNTSMPAWESVLSEQQIDAIISYIDEAFHHIKN
nr:cytochrome c [Thalassotalea sp. G2M2-11]